MPYTTIKYEVVRPHVALITLDRPERMNAINRVVFEELDDALNTIERDPEVRVFMLTGAPRTDGRPCFSAGADLKAMAEGVSTPVPLALGVTNRIDEFLKPSIAVIDGLCTTGGMELIMACDFRVAADTAQFSDWHLKRLGAGLGSWGASTRLSRLVGLAKAKEMLLTGILIDGAEAHRIGLVNRVVPQARLMDGALEMAQSIAEMRPEGVRLTLAFLETSIDLDKHQALRWAQLAPPYLGISSQREQGARAFVEQKRTAKEGGQP